MKTQEIYNNVLETRDFQHVSQYARRRQDGDLSHTQITAVIFAPKIAPKGIKLPPKRAAKWSIVRYPTKYKNLVTVGLTVIRNEITYQLLADGFRVHTKLPSDS